MAFVAGAFFERTLKVFSNELENEAKLELQIDQAAMDLPRTTLPPREPTGLRALRAEVDKKLHGANPPIFEHETILGSLMGGLLRESMYGLVELIPEGSFLDAGMQVRPNKANVLLIRAKLTIPSSANSERTWPSRRQIVAC